MDKPRRNTVGMYLKPRTRDRLNKFVAEYRLATGEYMSQSDAIDYLMDSYYESGAVPQPRLEQPAYA
jgi:hypothetical protein